MNLSHDVSRLFQLENFKVSLDDLLLIAREKAGSEFSSDKVFLEVKKGSPPEIKILAYKKSQITPTLYTNQIEVKVRQDCIRGGEKGKIIEGWKGFEVSCHLGCAMRFLVELESGEKRTYCGKSLEVGGW